MRVLASDEHLRPHCLNQAEALMCRGKRQPATRGVRLAAAENSPITDGD